MVRPPCHQGRLSANSIIDSMLGPSINESEVMQILTQEGKHSIDDALVLCVDCHHVEGDHAWVTVYLLDGDQVTGLLVPAERDEKSPSLAA
jgi:hypothetical protein